MTPLTLSDAWVYLSASPLVHLFATLLAFLLASQFNRLAGGTPLLHPVSLSIAMLIGFLLLTDTDYRTYFQGAQFLHFLLGPATVALAIPLYDHRDRVRRLLWPIIIATLTGIATAAVTTIAIGLILGLSEESVLSMAPKSVTSPIAMGIAEKVGGLPSLTAALVLLTGVIGCCAGPWIFRLTKITDPAIRGYTLGLTAHGFGTAHCFAHYGAVAGAFSGLAMGLSGLTMAFILPPIVHLFGL